MFRSNSSEIRCRKIWRFTCIGVSESAPLVSSLLCAESVTRTHLSRIGVLMCSYKFLCHHTPHELVFRRAILFNIFSMPVFQHHRIANMPTSRAYCCFSLSLFFRPAIKHTFTFALAAELIETQIVIQTYIPSIALRVCGLLGDAFFSVAFTSTVSSLYSNERRVRRKKKQSPRIVIVFMLWAWIIHFLVDILKAWKSFLFHLQIQRNVPP